MASVAAFPGPSGTHQCKVRDKLMVAFLLSVNRLNEDESRVEQAPTPDLRREAVRNLELNRRKSRKLQGLIVAHCANHNC